ncbi:Predicted metal-dependent hydrolase, TIM-barrel fold [Pseudarcicella hirudinis]|uniref:Predicted metal-dependent hydrolase, TIM-barrel fold n=1 Tax=Pseudarcicella hirudinis TaxID=1079859 RepID=A0A1I5U919_9BACT|nr:amidohydrolase family protein [Pseudarcicella hirudinis]SFP91773.1 Predicted metal-dependent hydrolase, TIM-barrel fold [Pseudarcicella hirudinis]
MKKLFIIAIALTLYQHSRAQQIRVDFEEYEPKSTLTVPENPKKSAKFPFIDVHNHQWEMNEGKDKLDKLITDMDKLNMGIMVNLSGRGWSEDQAKSTAMLADQIQNVRKFYPDRFVVFTNIDFSKIGEKGWTEKAVQTLSDDVKLRGAQGLKIYKNLGFSVKDHDKTVKVDDPRLDPIWAKAGELGIPVLIHTADPSSFWQPLDRFNERWLELKLHPNRKRDASEKKEFTWEELLEQQHNVFRKHKNTTFINAHMGWYPNNLAKLDSLMEALPNMYVEIGAVIAELGRQPITAKKFFEKRQDRILFGKDSWVPEEYATYFRVLETTDEYFPYHKKYHAFWRMYGMGLSDEVLKKVYYKNALKIIPGLDKSKFPS